MTDLNSAFKSIFNEVEQVEYVMTVTKTDSERKSIFDEEQNSRIDAFNEGFDDAYDLNPCEPLSDIPECRTAYFQGYAGGIEAWIKIEYASRIKVVIQVQNLSCPICEANHFDQDEWAIRPHKTHLCVNCGHLFEGDFKAVSRPILVRKTKPEHVTYEG